MMSEKRSLVSMRIHSWNTGKQTSPRRTTYSATLISRHGSGVCAANRIIIKAKSESDIKFLMHSRWITGRKAKDWSKLFRVIRDMWSQNVCSMYHLYRQG